MSRVIDFDDPCTFPQELRGWDTSFEEMILHKVNLSNVSEWWQIEHQLQDMHIDEFPLVTNYLDTHHDTEVAVSHCTRILDVDKFKKEGLLTRGGRNSEADWRLRELLSGIGLKDGVIDTVMSKVYAYWERDGKQRTDAVHFQFDRNLIYRDNRANGFALNLGGEILRWALEGCGKDLYKTEPYKRLWIWGKPCIVKFKCKIGDIHPIKQAPLVAEIVKYNIVTKIFKFPYEFEFTGMTSRNVPAENIISIEEIQGFVELQEKDDEFVGLYNELK